MTSLNFIVSGLLGEDYPYQQMFSKPIGIQLSAMPTKDASEVTNQIYIFLF